MDVVSPKTRSFLNPFTSWRAQNKTTKTIKSTTKRPTSYSKRRTWHRGRSRNPSGLLSLSTTDSSQAMSRSRTSWMSSGKSGRKRSRQNTHSSLSYLVRLSVYDSRPLTGQAGVVASPRPLWLSPANPSTHMSCVTKKCANLTARRSLNSTTRSTTP